MSQEALSDLPPPPPSPCLASCYFPRTQWTHQPCHLLHRGKPGATDRRPDQPD
ncbi:hypothetical protein Cadr_000011110 [Camelus dromedarius]|uniref:Uncharacterized protein n=1 Tax=Camelus dromedarius TaxID=9838 RepID=A0A5N4DV66_CAMDR|nr:hypothetical protein Cadr_000011110 [Camelus dromedarius]